MTKEEIRNVMSKEMNQYIKQYNNKHFGLSYYINDILSRLDIKGVKYQRLIGSNQQIISINGVDIYKGGIDKKLTKKKVFEIFDLIDSKIGFYDKIKINPSIVYFYRYRIVNDLNEWRTSKMFDNKKEALKDYNKWKKGHEKYGTKIEKFELYEVKKSFEFGVSDKVRLIKREKEKHI